MPPEKPALAIYRNRLKLSEQLQSPYIMLGFNVCAAESDDEAHYIRSSSLQSFLNLHKGMPGLLPPPIENFEVQMDEQDRHIMSQMSRSSAVGNAETVKAGIAEFVEETGADEFMSVCSIFDHAKRLRSF